MQFEVTLLKPLKYLQTSLLPPGRATTQKSIFSTRRFTEKIILLWISQAENTGNALRSCLFMYTTWAEISDLNQGGSHHRRDAPQLLLATRQQASLSLLSARTGASLTNYWGGGRGGKESQFLTKINKDLMLNTELTVG